MTSQQRLRVLSITSDEIDAQLLCYCSGDCTLCVCQIFEQRSSRESELHRSFEEWSCAESTVTCSGRRWCEMQQKISGLDSEVVEGITYLCAVCTMQLAVYTIPLSKESLLFSWMDDSIIYSSPYKISCSKLRYIVQLLFKLFNFFL